MTREEAIQALNEIFDDSEFSRYEAWYGGAMDMAIEALSADAEDRHYIKIYADDEPSVKAEKLYQICGETQPKEVTEWLKEYFPDMAIEALKQTEIVRCKDCRHSRIEGDTTMFMWCGYWNKPTDGTRYCSDGERSE